MIERLGRSHLKPLGYAGSHAMTISATQFLVLIMHLMTEANAKGRGRLSRAHVPSWLVTNTARRDVFVPGLRSRRVTLKTGDMRIESRRNRHSCTATRSMTGNALNIAETLVAGMIESHVEAAESGKCF